MASVTGRLVSPIDISYVLARVTIVISIVGVGEAVMVVTMVAVESALSPSFFTNAFNAWAALADIRSTGRRSSTRRLVWRGEQHNRGAPKGRPDRSLPHLHQKETDLD